MLAIPQRRPRMSSQKRERELARAKYERQQQRQNERASKARRHQQIAAFAVVGALVLAGVGWVVFNANNSDEISADGIPADETPADENPVDCAPSGIPRADDISFPEGPTPRPTTAKTMSLSTNCGDIVIELDPLAAETVASAAFLAENAFYNNTSCHRLTTAGIYVVQCGDPAGNGTGGPGYALPDENLPVEGTANYPAGTVAMANSGPGTSGSQFFLVYEDTTLPSGYTIWGQVVSGLEIVQAVADEGVSGGSTDGVPLQPLFINSATVS